MYQLYVSVIIVLFCHRYLLYTPEGNICTPNDDVFEASLRQCKCVTCDGHGKYAQYMYKEELEEVLELGDALSIQSETSTCNSLTLQTKALFPPEEL